MVFEVTGLGDIGLVSIVVLGPRLDLNYCYSMLVLVQIVDLAFYSIQNKKTYQVKMQITVESW